MTAAIATSRELKNKETGLDISVPEYREVSGLLTSYEEYHVIVITNLPYFKTIRNKMDNTVQFMVTKKYGDFEALHKTLSERFPATIFPEMPRKVFMMKDSTPQERRLCFDNLMRFIASNTKVCCSNPVLLFLGVKPDRIHQIEEKGDSEEKDTPDETDSKKSSANSSWQRSNISSSGSQQSSLFSDEPDDEFDFFKDASASKDSNTDIADEDDLFSTNSHTMSSVSSKKGVLLFSDNAADLTETGNAEGIYLPPGAIGEEYNKDASKEFAGLDEVEDNTDFLNIEDDFDQLLSDVLRKPAPKPKPSPTKKPVVTGTDRPTPAQRPAPASRSTAPGKAPPKPAPRKGKPSGSKEDEAGVTQASKTKSSGAEMADVMDDGDILKYIQDNAADNEASLDLF